MANVLKNTMLFYFPLNEVFEIWVEIMVCIVESIGVFVYMCYNVYLWIWKENHIQNWVYFLSETWTELWT